MIKIIHTADIHFGVENYGNIDSKTGIHSRLLDFERSFLQCIDYAIESKSDLFLFCGDAYKTTHPSPTQQKLMLRSLLKLYNAKIPIVIVIGNHDNPLSFGKANSLELFKDIPLDGFYVIEKPDLLIIETKSGPVQIIGIPWPTRTTLSLNMKNSNSLSSEITDIITDSVVMLIDNFVDKLNPGIPSILASHITVAAGIFSGSEKRAIYGSDPTFMISQLAKNGIDYVALGHLHRYQNLNPNGYPDVVYSGSIDRIDFGERRDHKGFCEVLLSKKNTTHKFIQINTRPFIQIDVELNNEIDGTTHICNEIDKYEIKNSIVKILYYIPNNISDSIDILKVERKCSSAHYLVGIIPIFQAKASRDRRSQSSVEMNTQDLLDSYFKNLNISDEKRIELLKKAISIYDCAHQEPDENISE